MVWDLVTRGYPNEYIGVFLQKASVKIVVDEFLPWTDPFLIKD